jgi:hypothetical protein
MSATLNNISLYIPRVFAGYSEKEIYDIIDEQGIGKLERVDLANYRISSDGKTEICSAYIHFEFWYDTIVNRNFQSRVIDSESEARIYTEGISYWIVLENKGRKFKPSERKPRIVIDNPTPTSIVEFSETASQFKNYVPMEYTESETYAQVNEIKRNVKEEEEFTAEEIDLIHLIAEEEADEQAETYEQMDEIATYMDEDDNELVTIDGRYVKSLEEQVAELYAENQRVNALYWSIFTAYQEEKIKAKALSDAIVMIKEK